MYDSINLPAVWFQASLLPLLEIPTKNRSIEWLE